MKSEDNLKDIFDLNDDESLPIKREEIVPAIQKSSELTPEEINTSLGKDYRTVRKNLRSLLKKGDMAIDEILDVARSSDSPRAYEVVAQLLKNLAEINKDLMGIHNSVLPKKESPSTANNTTNNTLFIGSTKELQSFLRQQRNLIIDEIDEEKEFIEVVNEMERFEKE